MIALENDKSADQGVTLIGAFMISMFYTRFVVGDTRWNPNPQKNRKYQKSPLLRAFLGADTIWHLSLAEKEGFEPSQRFARSTPLAGEPLQPYLGISPR